MTNPGQAWRIRPATLADTDAVTDCAQRAFAPYVALIGRKPAPMDADYAAQIAAGHVFVAAEPLVLGFVVFYPDGAQMMLDCVAVHPDAAGCGLGSALIRFCETAALTAGCTTVALYTNEKMTRNLSMYPGMGYQQVGHRIEDGFARVFFEKRLI